MISVAQISTELCRGRVQQAHQKCSVLGEGMRSKFPAAFRILGKKDGYPRL